MAGSGPVGSGPVGSGPVGSELAGVVLAAGLGTRLRPLTDERPKALVPVGGARLLDGALARLASLLGSGAGPGAGAEPGAGQLAVNAHHHADAVVQAVAGRAHVSREDTPLGTAGALAALAGWTDGRDVLLTNVDAWMPDPGPVLADLVAGWDGQRCRLLCARLAGADEAAGRARRDFTVADGHGVTYVGTCLLPAHLLAGLRREPAGLYEVLWRQEAAAGRLDLYVHEPQSPSRESSQVLAIDCGTVADYLRANLLATGGRSVVGAGAVVLGRLERSVVWDGAYVGPDEVLVDAVRAGTRERPVTAGL